MQIPEELDAEDWRNVFATNVDGVFHCCRAAYPAMKENGRGKVIIMSSVASKTVIAVGYTRESCSDGRVAYTDGVLGIERGSDSPRPIASRGLGAIKHPSQLHPPGSSGYGIQCSSHGTDL